VWSRGYDAVWLFDDARGWTLLGDQNGIGGTWVYAEHNPVHQVLITGSAEGAKLYRVGADGQISDRGGLEVSIYDGSAWNGVVTVDPTSGDYLILTPSTRELHVYDVEGDLWRPGDDQPPDLVDGGLVAMPIATHGVTWFTHCRSGVCRVLLYKHAG